MEFNNGVYTVLMTPFNEDGTIDQPKQIAGGHNESIFQPKWSPDHKLYYVSDRNGWWNLY